jgi:hypothetical protein
MNASMSCAGCGALVPSANVALHEVRCRAKQPAVARAGATGRAGAPGGVVAVEGAAAAAAAESAATVVAAAESAPHSQAVWQEHLRMIFDSDRVLAADLERDEQEELDERLARELAEDARAALPALVAPPWQEGCADGADVLSQLLLSSARSSASVASSADSQPAAPAAGPGAHVPPPHEPCETADAQHRRYSELASTIAEGHRLLAAASPRALSGLARAGVGVVGTPSRAGDLDWELELAIRQSMRQ